MGKKTTIIWKDFRKGRVALQDRVGAGECRAGLLVESKPLGGSGGGGGISYETPTSAASTSHLYVRLILNLQVSRELQKKYSR